MSCNNKIGFKGSTAHYGDPTLVEEIAANFKHWFDWSFLCLGAWTNVNGNTSGIYGGNFYTLNPLQDGSYTDNTVFFGIRKEWLHETGVNYQSPVRAVSEVFQDPDTDKIKVVLDEYEESFFGDGDTVVINTPALTGTYTTFQSDTSRSFLLKDTTSQLLFQNNSGAAFQNGDKYVIDFVNFTGTGTGGTIYGIHEPVAPQIYVDGVEQSGTFNIDYINGKVLFDSPQTGTVTASYSFRNVQSFIDSQIPWAFEVQGDSLNPNNISWQNEAESGDYSTDPVQRLQLPAVIIEVVPKRTSEGFQIGSAALRKNQDIMLTVISQNSYERNLITDILADQKNKTLNLYDLDRVARDKKLPLDYNGFLQSGGQTYKDIVANDDYFWGRAYILDAYTSEVKTKRTDLYMSKIRYKIQVIK